MITWGTITLVISIGQRFTAGSIGARVGKAGITFCSDSRWHVICVGYFKIQNILFHHIDFLCRGKDLLCTLHSALSWFRHVIFCNFNFEMCSAVNLWMWNERCGCDKTNRQSHWIPGTILHQNANEGKYVITTNQTIFCCGWRRTYCRCWIKITYTLHVNTMTMICWISDKKWKENRNSK